MVNKNASEGARALLVAFGKGYKVTKSGEVISPNDINLSLFNDSRGYLNFKICMNCGKKKNVPVHRFQAYMKFGSSIFDAEVVRHLDGNCKNNSWDNLELGTHKENSADRCPKEVKGFSIAASNKIRRFSDSEMSNIKEFYKTNKSYKKTMEKFGISTKSTMHRILNVDYVTKKD
jgi:hypothetical protein